MGPGATLKKKNSTRFPSTRSQQSGRGVLGGAENVLQGKEIGGTVGVTIPYNFTQFV